MKSLKNDNVMSVVGPSESQPGPARWLGRLVSCVWYLGPRLGWRYWKLQRRAHAEPDMLNYWAFNCRVEANIIEMRDHDFAMVDALRGWAAQLEKHAAHRAAGVSSANT